MRYLLTILTTALLTAFLCFWWLSPDRTKQITHRDVEAAQKLIDFSFEGWEIDTMLKDLNENVEDYALMHEFTLKNETPPSLLFYPLPESFRPDTLYEKNQWTIPEDVPLPLHEDELAFYTILQLASLIKNRKITATELTRLYLDRIKRYDDTLQSVITLTETLALQQAQQADKEIADGHYRGPLHGIPYGVKDLIAVEGYKTTWGSNTHKDQQIDHTATIVKKLEAAGAILIAKLTSGALARGDVWFDGQTKNPWDLTQGAQGSSAGSAAATVAGLVGFAIGTETMGSIVSPSSRCGASGLRPTYGRVSRDGIMTLSWSLDKIGPMARSAEDCALVFDVIQGYDTLDRTTVDFPFRYDGQIDLSQLSFGYAEDYFEKDTTHQALNDQTLATFRSLGASLVPVKLPDSTSLPIKALSLIMYAEAGAAFDDLTRTNLDDSMVRQDESARPNALRQSRFIPAVEYIQANRYRYQLIQKMQQLMDTVDVIVAPTRGFPPLLMTNMTGHPVVIVPNGFDAEGHPQSITIIGRLYDEATILEVAKAYQEATDIEEKHPPFFVDSE